MKRIQFHCDSSESLGSGHVMRCVALAEVFYSQGWEIVFSGNYEYPVWLNPYLKSLNFIKVSSNKNVLYDQIIDVVVADSYEFNNKKYEELFRYAKLRISIVDPINKPHDADIYFSNTPQEYFNNQFNKNNCCFGFKFAMVRSEILRIKERDMYSHNTSRIVIFTGGTAKIDVANFLLKVIQKSKIKNKIIIFGKPQATHLKNSDLDIEFEDFNTSYAKSLNRKDVIFCPSSGMSLELLALKHPIILYQYAENQTHLYRALVDNKMARGIGQIGLKSVEETAKNIEDLVFSPIVIENLKQKRLIDGLGALRIFKIVTNHINLI